MIFSRTSQRLEELKEKDDMSVSAILNFFDDICNDVASDFGTKLWELSVGNSDEAVLGLCRLANLIRRIYRDQENELKTSAAVSRWASASKRLEEAEPRLEELKREIERSREALAQIERRLAEVDDRQGLRDELQKKLQENQRVLSECDRLQEQIRQKADETEKIRQTRLPELKEKYAQEEERCKTASGEMEACKEELCKLEEQMNEQLLELQRETEKKTEMEGRLTAGKETLAALLEEQSGLLGQITEVSAGAETVEKEISAKKEERTKKEEELQTLQSCYGELCKTVGQLATDYSDRMKTLRRTVRKLGDVDARLEDDEALFQAWFANNAGYEKARSLFEDRLRTANTYLRDCQNSYEELRNILEREYPN